MVSPASKDLSPRQFHPPMFILDLARDRLQDGSHYPHTVLFPCDKRMSSLKAGNVSFIILWTLRTVGNVFDSFRKYSIHSFDLCV